MVRIVEVAASALGVVAMFMVLRLVIAPRSDRLLRERTPESTDADREDGDRPV